MKARHNSIILAVINGEFTLKRFIKNAKGIFLYAENPNFAPIEIKDGIGFEVWGVVIHVINSLK
jgi:DNA polymerase V